jgi:transcriptional regulator with XRE-family HTH domain
MARQRERTAFGQRLYDARKNAKLTQVKLAKAAGMSQGNLAELEWEGQGSSYTPMLAAACGVSAEWLAGATDVSADPDWPFGSTITKAEWRQLPDEVRGEIVRAARRYVLEYRDDLAQSGKSSDSSHGAGKRAAQA